MDVFDYIEFVPQHSKPANVLLQGDVPSGNYKAQLADFGVAAMTQNREEDEDLTSETGTYRYVDCNISCANSWISLASFRGCGCALKNSSAISQT